MLNFYRFLSLEEKKIGTSHGFILSPLIFAEQGGNKHAVYGWGFRGKGAKDSISYKCNHIKTPAGKL